MNDWSPDGGSLVGVGEDKDYVLSLESGQLTPLTTTRGAVGWLADGRRVLFLPRKEHGGAGALTLVDIETQTPKVVYQPPEGEIGWADLAPGDEAIYFSLVTLDAEIWTTELAPSR